VIGFYLFLCYFSQLVVLKSYEVQPAMSTTIKKRGIKCL